MIGIELLLDDGSKEWVDPVMEIREENGNLIIHNGAYEYTFPLNRIVSRSEYDPEEET